MLRTLAFGDLAAGVWGATWLPAGDGGFMCVGAPDALARSSARLEGSGEHADWRLLDEGTELTVSPAGEAVATADGEAPATGFDQLCRVRGRFELDAAEHTVDCLGRRGARGEGFELDRVGSVRDISAWFEPDVGLAVVSLRPRRARGHDADVVTATVLDPAGSGPVADPRFSTTYTAAGRPVRASFELWLGQAEEEFPRRAAGEAVGPEASLHIEGLDVRAALFKWHSRSLDGAGVYILARRA